MISARQRRGLSGAAGGPAGRAAVPAAPGCAVDVRRAPTVKMGVTEESGCRVVTPLRRVPLPAITSLYSLFRSSAYMLTRSRHAVAFIAATVLFAACSSGPTTPSPGSAAQALARHLD